MEDRLPPTVRERVAQKQAERASAANRARLRIGKVVADGLSVWGRTLHWLLAMSLLVNAPVVALSWSRLSEKESPGIALLITLLNSVVGMIVQGASMLIVIQALRRERIRIAAALGAGLRRILPLFLVGVVIGLATAVVGIPVGLLYLLWSPLLVFGVFALLPTAVWYVAAPAVVIERAGVGAALRRSSNLTKGNVWRIFGLVVVVTLAQGGLVALIVKMSGVDAEASLAEAQTSFLLTTAVTILMQSLAVLFPVVTYHQLRLAREGVDLDALASVFD